MTTTISTFVAHDFFVLSVYFLLNHACTYGRGISKLKATRKELQRLEAQVAKSERSAADVVATLRALPRAAGAAPENLLQLRGDAATQLAALRQQRAAAEKCVYRIASQDI